MTLAGSPSRRAHYLRVSSAVAIAVSRGATNLGSSLVVGSDPIHAVGEGRLGCEASGPPRGATWVKQTQTRSSSVFSGRYVASMNGYWPRFFRYTFSSGGSEELHFAIRSGVG